MADLRELIKTWRANLAEEISEADIAYNAALKGCADELERALAAQPAPMSRNDAFNLADTVAEHYACGRPEEARQAIMAMAAQPATVPEGMSLLVDALEGAMIESLHGEGFDLWAKNRGKLRNRLPESVGAIIVKMRAMLAAAPSAEAAQVGGAVYTVECVHFSTQEGTCFFEVKTDDPPENGAKLYAHPAPESREAETMRDWSARMAKCEPLGHEIDKLMADNIEVFLDGKPEAGQREGDA